MRKRTPLIVIVGVTAFAAGTCASFFLLPLWVVTTINIAKEGSRADWLGFAGGLIGSLLTAVVAGVAIYFAWRGIMRQLRITIISREEDRIERDLPGLRDAHSKAAALVARLQTPTSIKAVCEPLVSYIPAGVGHALTRNEPPLPDTDPATRRLFEQLHIRLYKCAQSLRALESQSQHQRNIAKPVDFTAAWTELFVAVGEMRAFAETLKKKISRYEDALPRFRSQIEQYFDYE